MTATRSPDLSGSGDTGRRFQAHSPGLPVDVRRVEIIGSDVAQNFFEIGKGVRVELVTGHGPDCGRRAAALLSRKWAPTSSLGIGFTLPLFRSS